MDLMIMEINTDPTYVYHILNGSTSYIDTKHCMLSLLIRWKNKRIYNALKGLPTDIDVSRELLPLPLKWQPIPSDKLRKVVLYVNTVYTRHPPRSKIDILNSLLPF